MGGMTQVPRAGASARTTGMIAVAMVATATLMVGSQAKAGDAGGTAWRVGEIQGEARIRTADGPWRKLGKGDAIAPNSEIATGAAGRLLLAKIGRAHV